MFALLDLILIAKINTKLLVSIIAGVIELVEEKRISEYKSLYVYSYNQLQEAFRFIQSGKHISKIVLEPRENDIVIVSLNALFCVLTIGN